MLRQNFLLSVHITLRAPQTDSFVVSKQYNNILRLLLKIQYNCYAEHDKFLKISAPLELVGDSVSDGQF